jgi:hypothetical protein
MAGAYHARRPQPEARISSIPRLVRNCYQHSWRHGTHPQGLFVFDGNVKFEIDGKTTTASRAVIETAWDGAMMLQLTDATLVGPHNAETPLGE